MARIPIAMIGVDHPHSRDWYRTLDEVPELMPVAHYDPRPEAARGMLIAPYDDLPVYGEMGELLSKHRVEAAMVMLPLNEAEKALAILAEAGVHIMAEKPVARTAAALEEVAGVLSPGTLFYSGYCRRLEPAIEDMRGLVGRGILGELWSVEGRYITSRVGRHAGAPSHRDPDCYLFREEESRGGILQWLGCHTLDLMLYVTGQKVESVMSMTARLTSEAIEVEDSANCLLKFGNGMMGSLSFGYLLPPGSRQLMGLELRGSLGWFRWDLKEGTFIVHSEHPDWAVSPTRDFNYPKGPSTTYGSGIGEALLRDFVRCMRSGGSDPLLTVGDAIAVLEVIDAAYESAECGRAVFLNDST